MTSETTRCHVILNAKLEFLVILVMDLLLPDMSPGTG